MISPERLFFGRSTLQPLALGFRSANTAHRNTRLWNVRAEFTLAVGLVLRVRPLHGAGLKQFTPPIEGFTQDNPSPPVGLRGECLIQGAQLDPQDPRNCPCNEDHPSHFFRASSIFPAYYVLARRAPAPYSRIRLGRSPRCGLVCGES